MSECKICQKRIESGEFCEYHELAKKNIYDNYEYWNEAYDGISFKDYLTKISTHDFSGRWTKEVAEYLLKIEDF